MTSIAVTYDQALAIGQLTRDERPEQITVTNPQDVAEGPLFVSFYGEDLSMTKHIVHRDGRVSSEVAIAA